MSQQDGKRISDAIASKLIEGGFPSDLDGLRFNAALNIWEFVPFGGGGGAFDWSGNYFSDNQGTDIEYYSYNPNQLAGVALFNEPLIRIVISRGMTADLLTHFLDANTSAAVFDVTVRINGVDGNLNVQYPAGISGLLQDITNTDALVLGDLIDWEGDKNGDAGIVSHIADTIRLTPT